MQFVDVQAASVYLIMLKVSTQIKFAEFVYLFGINFRYRLFN